MSAEVDTGAGWIDVGALDQVPRLGAKVVSTGDGKIAVFRTGADEILALNDRCPHKGGPLSQGIVHGNRVTCPLHGWVIDLACGEAVAPDRGRTETIQTRVENGRIFLLRPLRRTA